MRFFDTRMGCAVKRLIIACEQCCLKLFYFLPIKKRRILLCSFGGDQYSDNPKYMSEYLAAHYGQSLELIWGFRHPKRFRDVPDIKSVRYYSPRWFYYALTASVFITNTGIRRLMPKRNGQFSLNTWHGGGAYKRVGPDAYKLSEAERSSQHKYIQKTDLYLSSSERFTHYALRQDIGYQGEVLNSGMPRNDLFFSAERIARASEKVRQSLGLKGYVVLYAPTFRGNNMRGYKINYHFPYEQALAVLRERFGESVSILKRAHNGCVMADSSPKEVIDVSDWPNMQELLCAADMLITDYSSSMWDFALLGRPCLLYQNDLETYERERGICTSVDQWPGISCRSNKELLDAIRNLDERACAEIAGEHLRACESYETGTATEQACRRVIAHIEGKQTKTQRMIGRQDIERE